MKALAHAACAAFITAFASTHGLAQLMVQQISLNEEVLSPTTLFQATVVNNGAEATVRFEGRLSAKSGEQVLSFQSMPMRLRAGANAIAASGLTMRKYAYGNGALGRQAQLNQRLSDGDYRFCLRVVEEQGEADDELCEAVHMESLLFLDLVQPWNGDTLDELRPALTWQLTGTPAAVNDADVRITLALMPRGTSAAQALAGEVPVFRLDRVMERTLAYPPGMPDLQRGQCYAWQAERIAGGRVVDRSDPWSFCIRQRTEPMADKYIRLDRLQPGTVYKAVDRRLFFRYDEPYASSALRCAVIGPDGKRIEPEVNNDGAGMLQASGAAPGANLFELDLSPYGLKPGIHSLQMQDGKGRRYELQFQSQF